MKHLIYHVASPSMSVGTCPLHTETADRKVLWLGLGRLMPVYLPFQPQCLPQRGGDTAVWSMQSSWRFCCFSRLLRFQKTKDHKEICFWFGEKNQKTVYSISSVFTKGSSLGGLFPSAEENGCQLDFHTVHSFLSHPFKIVKKTDVLRGEKMWRENKEEHLCYSLQTKFGENNLSWYFSAYGKLAGVVQLSSEGRFIELYIKIKILLSVFIRCIQLSKGWATHLSKGEPRAKNFLPHGMSISHCGGNCFCPKECRSQALCSITSSPHLTCLVQKLGDTSKRRK